MYPEWKINNEDKHSDTFLIYKSNSSRFVFYVFSIVDSVYFHKRTGNGVSVFFTAPVSVKPQRDGEAVAMESEALVMTRTMVI